MAKPVNHPVSADVIFIKVEVKMEETVFAF